MAIDVSNVLEHTAFAETEQRLVKPEDLTTAELAECMCPEFCERDHDTD
jgi:hypothetical protein